MKWNETKRKCSKRKFLFLMHTKRRQPRKKYMCGSGIHSNNSILIKIISKVSWSFLFAFCFSSLFLSLSLSFYFDYLMPFRKHEMVLWKWNVVHFEIQSLHWWNAINAHPIYCASFSRQTQFLLHFVYKNIQIKDDKIKKNSNGICRCCFVLLGTKCHPFIKYNVFDVMCWCWITVNMFLCPISYYYRSQNVPPLELVDDNACIQAQRNQF